jgi:hypothetical protein
VTKETKARLVEKGLLPTDEDIAAMVEGEKMLAKPATAPLGPEERLLSDEDLGAFSAALGLNIQTKHELLWRVKQMTTVNVEGVKITLDPRLLTRLHSRAVRIPFPDYLRDTVRKALFDVCGY